MDDLRSPVVDALERLTVDLAVGRYGDPHVGFLVLVHPDQHPTIITVSGRGAHDLAHMICQDDREGGRKRGRLFDWKDFEDASTAVRTAGSAWSGYAYRSDKSLSLGRHIDKEVRGKWQAGRDAVVKAAMDRAAFEESHQAQCPNCSRRFTERGLTQHQARARWPGCSTGTQDPPADRPAPPQRRACPLPRCPWVGLDDAVPDHLASAHQEYVVG